MRFSINIVSAHCRWGFTPLPLAVELVLAINHLYFSRKFADFESSESFFIACIEFPPNREAFFNLIGRGEKLEG